MSSHATLKVYHYLQEHNNSVIQRNVAYSSLGKPKTERMIIQKKNRPIQQHAYVAML